MLTVILLLENSKPKDRQPKIFFTETFNETLDKLNVLLTKNKMETPIQILSEVDKDVHYTPRQLNAVKEMAFRFASLVLQNLPAEDIRYCMFNECQANLFLNELVPGRDEKYDQDNNKTITEQ